MFHDDRTSELLIFDERLFRKFDLDALVWSVDLQGLFVEGLLVGNVPRQHLSVQGLNPVSILNFIFGH